MALMLTGGWWQPALALALFLLAHRWPTRPAVRAALVGRLGERGFTILYSLLSLLLLGWLIAATLGAPVIVLWDYAPWQPWVTLLAMLPACLLIAAAVAAPNPLSFGGARNEAFDPAAPGIVGFCRHPLLLALALWAGAHIVPNGELATLLLFLPLAAFSLCGMRLIDRRRREVLGEARWRSLAARSSLLPGGALLAGRWRPRKAGIFARPVTGSASTASRMRAARSTSALVTIAASSRSAARRSACSARPRAAAATSSEVTIGR